MEQSGGKVEWDGGPVGRPVQGREWIQGPALEPKPNSSPWPSWSCFGLLEVLPAISLVKLRVASLLGGSGLYSPCSGLQGSQSKP